LWETLAQRHLFKRETEFLTFQAITTDPIRDICEIRPDVPPLLGDAIARAVSRDRDHRFATARALGEALAQAVGPLGGVYGAAPIADEIERSFVALMDEQKQMLDMARAGDVFDLDRSNPMAHAGKLSVTPVSNIKVKLEAAQAEVAHYVQAKASLKRGDDSSSGFTPPPGSEGLYMRAPAARSRRISAVLETGEVVAVPLPVPAHAARPPVAATATLPTAKASRLPWVLMALVLFAAGGSSAWLYSNKKAAAKTEISPPPPPPPPVEMKVEPKLVTPPPVPVIDAGVEVISVEELDAGVAPTPAPPVIHHTKKPVPIVTEPAVPAGPPGFITIDSTPVYAVIYIDGKKIGETPLVHISVAAGKHSVRAVSGSGTTRNLSITIESGKTAPVRRIEW
jgi:hypothetical protein